MQSNPGVYDFKIELEKFRSHTGETILVQKVLKVKRWLREAKGTLSLQIVETSVCHRHSTSGLYTY